MERRLLAGPRAPRPDDVARPFVSSAVSGDSTRMPSREASHATWYSGLTMLVVPGAPVSSCVA